MLAESKSRKKQTCSVTGVRSGKNTAWYKEKNNVAFNLISKMGWSEGEGLGAQKQGNADYIHVHRKNDGHGVGFDSCQFDKLSMHMDTFNSILSGLSSTSMEKKPTTPSTKRTELISKSKFQDVAQVRRHKLCARRLQNKNLSNKRSKDVEIVLGSFGASAYRAEKKRSDDSVSRQEKVEGLMRCITKRSGFCRLPDPESEDEERHCSRKFENNLEKTPDGTAESEENVDTENDDISIRTYNSKLSCSEYFKLKMEQKKASMKSGMPYDNLEAKDKHETNFSEKPRSGKKLKSVTKTDKTETTSFGDISADNFFTPDKISRFCRIPDAASDDDEAKKYPRKFDQKFAKELKATTERSQHEDNVAEDLDPKIHTSKLSYAEYFKMKMEQKKAKKGSQKSTDSQEKSKCEDSSSGLDLKAGGEVNEAASGEENKELAFEECLEDIELMGAGINCEEKVSPIKKLKKRKREKSKEEVLEYIRRLVASDDVPNGVENDETCDLSNGSLRKKLKLAEELTERVAEMEDKKPKKKKKLKSKHRDDNIVAELCASGI